MKFHRLAEYFFFIQINKYIEYHFINSIEKKTRVSSILHYSITSFVIN